MIARGVKKKNSKLASIIQSMCFVNFSIYKGKSAYFINEGIIIDSFQDLLRDFETIAYSSYICELMNLSIPENEKNDDIFTNAVKCLYLIKNAVGDMELLIRSFELKLIKSVGYRINTDICAECGKRIKRAFFSEIGHGFSCDECGGGRAISTGTVMTVRALVNFKIENIHRINAGENIKTEIKRITDSYLNEICSRRPKSLDMLKFL